MKKIYFGWFFIFIGLTMFSCNDAMGADYCVFDKENSQLLMAQNGVQFTEKIDIGIKPDQVIATNSPDQYIALYTPKAPKKGFENEASKGACFVYNRAQKTVEVIELGYGPFNWVYTKDRMHFYISYRSSQDLNSFELLHYDTAGKQVEKVSDISKPVGSLCLSEDETVLYGLISGEAKKHIPGKVMIFTASPFKNIGAIETAINPKALFVLDAQKLVLIDADEKNKKQPGFIKIINASNGSTIQEYPIPAPYKITSFWYKEDRTLIAIADTPKQQSMVFKMTPGATQTFTTKTDWLNCLYHKDKGQLFLVAKKTLRTVDFDQNTETSCETGLNVYQDPFSDAKFNYSMKYFPDAGLALLYCPNGGNAKLIDLKQNIMIQNCGYGRSGAKFKNTMVNIFANALAMSVLYSPYTYYPGSLVNFFEGGTTIAVDAERMKYFFLSSSTSDVTVFGSRLDNPQYIVAPKEKPMVMLEIEKPNLQILLVTNKTIYRIDSSDLSLTALYEFHDSIRSCFFYRDQEQIMAVTDRELAVINPVSLKVENGIMLYGNPGESRIHLQEGEQRYYFVPAL